MPSLRRSFSSSAVRSSPYPTSLSTSSNRARASGQHPRRSSGSSTTERRVLADIEWWRVSDGQCPPHVQDQDQDQYQDVVQTQDNTVLSVGGSVTLSAGGGPQAPSPSLHGFSLDLTQSIPVDELATFSIAPHSPSRRWHSPDSSPSSLESSPQADTVPLEVIHLALGPESPAVELYNNTEVPLSPSSLRAPSRPASMLLGFRSFSFGGFSSRENAELQFADMGGDTFSLDQNLFH